MSLKKKIKQKEAQIGVIGLGYVGLPLAIEFAKKGFSVTGIDIDESKVAGINAGENYIPDIADDTLQTLVKRGNLRATKDMDIVADLDAVMICVPTPLSKIGDPDISYIIAAIDVINKGIHKDLLIILESTTYPGTTREILSSRLEKSGLTIGEDYYLCFSPERIDPGNKKYTIANTPKVIGGVTVACTQLGALLYEQIVDEVVTVSSPETAEMVKLLENTYRSINIGLVNEVAIMCEKLGIDVWEVIDAAATKPYGFMKFTPGPGLGGHCIPIDPQYLSWKMRTLDYNPRFINLAAEINSAMPAFVKDMVANALNGHGKALNGSSVLILGAAYKKDIDDVRESPALDLLMLLETAGAIVNFFDPYVADIVIDNKTKTGLTELSAEQIQTYDAVIILTDHSNVDYELVKKQAVLIIDTRNVYPLNHDEKIIRLGVGKKDG
jgi:UDP-N-acetyl-D-glucosamine dehydrogenase